MALSELTVRRRSSAGRVHRSRGTAPLSRRTVIEVSTALVLSAFAFVGLFPYLYGLWTSVKSNSQFVHNETTPTWPFHFGNYVTAWGDVAPYLVTSVIVAACTMLGCIALGSVTAYTLARFRFPGRRLFYGLVAILLMVPTVASLIPLFVLMRNLGLLNSYPDLIIPQLTTQTVFAVVVMKVYIEQIPKELFDAAQVDGASATRMYWSVTMPLARPIIGTVALFSVIAVGSEYFWPELTILTSSLRTVPVGVQFFQGEVTTSYGPMFAGYLIASAPLLILFTLLSRSFLGGIQGGLVAQK